MVGVWPVGEREANREGTMYLKSHSECEWAAELELDSPGSCFPEVLSPPSFAPLSSREEAPPVLAAKAWENTFFPSVLTEEAKWFSSQRGAHASRRAVCWTSLEWTEAGLEGGDCGRSCGCRLGRVAVNLPRDLLSMPPKEC